MKEKKQEPFPGETVRTDNSVTVGGYRSKVFLYHYQQLKPQNIVSFLC